MTSFLTRRAQGRSNRRSHVAIWLALILLLTSAPLPAAAVPKQPPAPTDFIRLSHAWAIPGTGAGDVAYEYLCHPPEWYASREKRAEIWLGQEMISDPWGFRYTGPLVCDSQLHLVLMPLLAFDPVMFIKPGRMSYEIHGTIDGCGEAEPDCGFWDFMPVDRGTLEVEREFRFKSQFPIGPVGTYFGLETTASVDSAGVPRLTLVYRCPPPPPDAPRSGIALYLQQSQPEPALRYVQADVTCDGSKHVQVVKGDIVDEYSYKDPLHIGRAAVHIYGPGGRWLDVVRFATDTSE